MISTAIKPDERPNVDKLPRFCTTDELAAAFGFSRHWIYKLLHHRKGPPRLSGVRPYRYDTHSAAFKEWLKELGVDVGELDRPEAQKV